MLYDDIQQLEVRYVISLDYHDVDIYGGSDKPIPEGELWVKRHAIRLKRKQTQVGDKVSSLPFFLFGENLSEKEDFYFALLKNQHQSSDDVPEAEEFEVRHIVNLVQKLHSSEEHLATRWLNALIGRLFLAIYKTEELEDFIRDKLMKKLSRVKKPIFITRLALQKMDLGTSGPFITNPRLKDLTVNGDCTIEADVDYSGNFRLEVGATARIELGTRFKAREVDLVLAITVRKLHGHALLRFKPPPSNRVWVTFEKMPQLDLAVEPIVSSRQITYTVLLRAIESRIREVVAESLVLPFWDDIPFLKSTGKKYRGGIWKREKEAPSSIEVKTEEPEDEAEAGGPGISTPDLLHMTAKDDRNMSMPVLSDLNKLTTGKKTATSLSDITGNNGKPPPTPPRLMRSSSFASAVVTTNNVDSDAAKLETESSKRDSATSFLKDLSARSQTGSASGSQAGSPPVESTLATAMKERSDSLASKSSSENIASSTRQPTKEFTTVPTSSVMDLTPTNTHNILSTTPPALDQDSRPGSVQEESKPSKTFAQTARSLTAADRKQALASAQATAQKWGTIGWGVLARNKQQKESTEHTSGNKTPSSPMGRGHPLPPPGIPLPMPPRPTTISTMASMLPKRKPVLPKRPDEKIHGSTDSLINGSKTPTTPKPPLPDRRRRQSSRADLGLANGDDEVMVVEAPVESAPTSPVAERKDLTQDDFFGHGEADEVPGLAKSQYHPTTGSSAASFKDPSEIVVSNAPESTKTSLSELSPLSDFDRAYSIINGNTAPGSPNKEKPKPPELPPRTVSQPPSPTASIKRKPVIRALTKDSEEHGPMSPQAAEVSNRERSLSYLEASSAGGGFNE